MNALPFFLQSTALLFAPVILLVTFTLLLIPSLLATGAKPDAAAKAIGCYILKTVGLILIAASVIQLTYGLIIFDVPTGDTLTVLVLLLVTGIGIMIHQSRIVATIDTPSVSVVRLVFSHTCELVGALVALGSGLSLMISLLIAQDTSGWEMSGTLLLLGMLLMILSSVHIRIKNGHRVRATRKR